jgi:hypothetical protein
VFLDFIRLVASDPFCIDTLNAKFKA